MINRLLYKLTARLPCRLIKTDDRPYLERYYAGTLCGVTFYLHRFVSSDSERHLHNHPWRHAGSIVLTGGYTEEVVTDLCPAVDTSGCVTESRRVRWFNRIDGARFHRISDAAPGTWTLFFHGERQRVICGMVSRLKGWGFLERDYILGYHQVTVFKPVEAVTDPTWYLDPDTPTGETAGRV